MTVPHDAWLAVTIAMASAAGWHRVRGTTLAAPAAWCLVSTVTMALVALAISWGHFTSESLSSDVFRYAASVSTFCPLMAVLGAKRPQDRGWQWVVASLWLILLVPAGQALVASGGDRLELFGAWRLLLAAMIAMGLLNYLPTRFALPALLVAAGQSLLLGSYVFGTNDAQSQRTFGLTLLGAAAIATWFLAKRIVSSDDAKSGKAKIEIFNQRWSSFRDGWGAFWGLRVMQRVNQTAEIKGWPARLEWWDGFTPKDETLDAQELSKIQQTLDSLLRRFERP